MSVTVYINFNVQSIHATTKLIKYFPKKMNRLRSYGYYVNFFQLSSLRFSVLVYFIAVNIDMDVYIRLISTHLKP